MPEFTFVARLIGAPEYGIGTFSDLDIAQGGDGITLYASSRADQTITTLSLTAGQTASPSGYYSLPAEVAGVGSLEITLIDTGAHQMTLAMARAPQGLAALDLTAAGLDDPLSAVISAQVDGQILLFAAPQQGGIERYRMTGPNDLTPLPDPETARSDLGPGISAMTSCTIAGQPFLFAALEDGNQVQGFQIDTEGNLTQTTTLGADQGLGLNAPGALEQVTMNGKTYLIVAASGSSSISVLQVGPDGSLAATDHLVDDRTSRFQGISALDVIEADGRAYVIAGGADDGLSLFTLLPDGRLLHLDTIADSAAMGLDNIDALRAVALDGALQVFAASASEAGITQMSIATGTPGDTLIARAEGGRLEGGPGDDIVMGGIGDDDLRGGAGDDIVMGGLGLDRLYGGAGKDIFVISGDGQGDQIRDFEPGQDRIDLSDWSMLRDGAQLELAPLSNGGSIRFGAENLRIYTSDGNALSLAQIQAALGDSYLHHSVRFLSADQTITGSGEDDILRGANGDDTLLGGDGADALFGGAGFDTASYAHSRGTLVVDLMDATHNSGAAQGDSYDSIENLRGGSSRDTLSGDHGANLIGGASNGDILFGRGGDDELRGGKGKDILIGGTGGDLLKGGALQDRADYRNSVSGLTADLRKPGNNTGEAEGDRYVDIEDLGGSAHKDALYGDGGDNRIYGGAGGDRLYGRGGNDQLTGGSQRDWLDGGAGDDDLRGGRQADTFVFRSGHDRALDFKPHQGDVIALDTRLWDGTLTAQDVVTTFGQIHEGHVVLEFGDHSLSIETQTTLEGLADDLLLI